MAIQMRRGLLANYDQDRMLAGEWAVSIDNDTDNQRVFIAFAPGVDKEIMLVENAQQQIETAAAEATMDAASQAKAWARGNSFTVDDYASGDGFTKSFTLSDAPSSIQGVYVNGTATSAYTLSGSTITFTTAPAVGLDNIHVAYTVNTSTNNSKYYSENAADYKNQAQTAATNASTANTNAQTAKADAQTAKTQAKTYRDEAEQFRDQAAASAGSVTYSFSVDSEGFLCLNYNPQS